MDLLIVGFLIAIFGVCAAETTCGPAEYKNKDECCPMCGKGYVVHRDCTEFSSTTCIPCVGDTYMSEPNGLKRCFKCKMCDSNQGLNPQQKCTTFSDAVCAVLPGYYCGSIEHDECTFGVKHSVCSPGQGVKTPGTERTDTVCENCREGYFSIDGTKCIEHTNCADLGEELEEKGSLNSDNKCWKPPRRRDGLIVATVLFAFPVFVVLQQLYHICKVPPRKNRTGGSATDQDSIILPAGDNNMQQPPIQESVQGNSCQDNPVQEEHEDQSITDLK